MRISKRAGPRIAAAVLTVAALGAAWSLVPAGAREAPVPARTGTLVDAAIPGGGAEAGTGTGAGAVAGIEVLCRVAVDPPNYVPSLGTVVGQARTLCNFAVTGIAMTISIRFNGVEVGTQEEIEFSTFQAGATVATPTCLSGGAYEVFADVSVIFPAGVVPPTARETFSSGPLTIEC